MSRPTHRVSAKIALYNPARTHVILADYGERGFGLPGGHLEADEEPEAALVREIKEELGFDLDPNIIERKDFWRHSGGRIILGFIATIPDDQTISVNLDELAGAPWVKVSDIINGNVPVDSYAEFIKKNI